MQNFLAILQKKCEGKEKRPVTLGGIQVAFVILFLFLDNHRNELGFMKPKLTE